MTSARVVHVCKVSGIAGAENHLLSLLPGLAARGLGVHMLVLGSDAETSGFRLRLTAAGIASDRVSIRAPLDPVTFRDLTRRLRALRPAIVHTHLIHADLHGQAAALRVPGARRISSRHNTDPFRRRAAVRWLDGRELRRVDRVIAISRAVARFTVEVEGADPAKVRTVPYGLDPALSSPEADRSALRMLGLERAGPLIGMVGRTVPQKGIDVLLEAFPRVLVAHPSARLVVVGDGPQRPALKRRALELGLGDAVRFTGWVDRAANLMSACDVVVIPSRWEGFGMVALEAMAAGRPIVASRVDALEEVVVDGETGVLVPAAEPHALADAVGALLSDPERAAALGRAGRRRLETEFSLERMVGRTVAVYDELLTPSGDDQSRLRRGCSSTQR
jgi:glycosyltransferase involved in cell wall biosynthesis